MMAASQPSVVKNEALMTKGPVGKDDTRLHLPCSHRCCMSCVERDDTRCEGCSKNKIEARCTICLKLLFFRCGVVQKECKTSNKKHDIEAIEELLEEGQTRVKQWMETTNTNVNNMKRKLAPLVENHTALEARRNILRRKLSAVEEQMTPIEQEIKYQRHILDENSSVLEAAKVIYSESDSVKIIRLSEQIHAQQRGAPGSSAGHAGQANPSPNQNLPPDQSPNQKSPADLSSNQGTLEPQPYQKTPPDLSPYQKPLLDPSTNLMSLSDPSSNQKSTPDQLPERKPPPPPSLKKKTSTGLMYVPEHPTRSQCVSVDFHNIIGDILIGCDDIEGEDRQGMKILDRHSQDVRDVTKHVVHSVQ